MAEIFGFDAYAPKEIAERLETVGVAKARLPLLSMMVLGVLAGGFIGLGALYFTLVTSDSSLPFAVSRVLGGVVFSLGLILVVVAGAELFTGNNMLVMAWASGRISTLELMTNWLVIYATNFVGAAGLVLIVYLANHTSMNGGEVAANAVKIAAAKTNIPFVDALFRGILCNMLVCLAVWLAMAGRSVMDKVMAIVFPISAFVAAGFEHSIANMYFIPLGIALRDSVPAAALGGADLSHLNWAGFVQNLVPVTIGNIVGGALLVAACYMLVYRRAELRGRMERRQS